MSDPVRLSLAEAEALACAALVASCASPENALPTARALVAAEADGQAGHGLSRVPSYAMQSRAGKVDGRATPVVERVAAPRCAWTAASVLPIRPSTAPSRRWHRLPVKPA